MKIIERDVDVVQTKKCKIIQREHCDFEVKCENYHYVDSHDLRNMRYHAWFTHKLPNMKKVLMEEKIVYGSIHPDNVAYYIETLEDARLMLEFGGRDDLFSTVSYWKIEQHKEHKPDWYIIKHRQLYEYDDDQYYENKINSVNFERLDLEQQIEELQERVSLIEKLQERIDSLNFLKQKIKEG